MRLFQKAIFLTAILLGFVVGLSSMAWAGPPFELKRDPKTVTLEALSITPADLEAGWPGMTFYEDKDYREDWVKKGSYGYYFSRQFFSADGGFDVSFHTGAGEGLMKDFNADPYRLIKSVQENKDMDFFEVCTNKGYPFLVHYTYTSGRYFERFQGYAKGYPDIHVVCRNLYNDRPITPPPGWLENVFFKWLERQPALDQAGAVNKPGLKQQDATGQKQQSPTKKLTDGRLLAATAGSGLALAGGLLLQLLLGGGSPLPNTGNPGGKEASGQEQGEEGRRKGRSKYWVSTLAHSQSLRADGRASTWVYARVNSDDPEADTAGLTSGMNFGRGGSGGPWLRIGNVQFTGGYAAVQVTAEMPADAEVTAGETVASVIASVSGPDGHISASQDLTLTAPFTGHIETYIENDRTGLMLDGHDGLWLYATVVPVYSSGEGIDLEAVKNTLSFEAEGEGGTLVTISAPRPVNEWRGVYLRSEPQPAQGGLREAQPAPPSQLSVLIRARVDEQREITARVTLDLTPRAALEVDREEVAIQNGRELPVELKATVSNAGREPWEFMAEFDSMPEEVNSISVEPDTSFSATVILDLKQAAPEAAEVGFRDYLLRVTARQKDELLTSEVKVCVAREGIDFRHETYPEDRFHLKGDGKTSAEIDFFVYRWDSAGKDLVSDPELAQKLMFTDQSDDPQTKSVFKALGEPEIAFVRIRDLNAKSGVWSFKTLKEIPADGRVLPVNYRVSAAWDGKEFSRTLNLKLETTDLGPGSKVWEEELEKTRNFIDKHVPEYYRPKFHEIIRTRMYTLGVEGIYELRRQLWVVAQNLILGEGGEGYNEEAKWAGRIADTLDWAKWAGDRAFNAVASSLVSPYGALGLSLAKDLMVSAIVAYQDGKTLDEWLWSQVKGVFSGTVDTVIMLDEVKERIGPAKAWAIYVGWRFLWNLNTVDDEGKPRSYTDAAWQTVKDTTNATIDSFLGEEVKKSAKAHGWQVYEKTPTAR